MLCTNIPNDEGLQAGKETLDAINHQPPGIIQRHFLPIKVFSGL
jgi:hypothetical protein